MKRISLPRKAKNGGAINATTTANALPKDSTGITIVNENLKNSNHKCMYLQHTNTY